MQGYADIIAVCGCSGYSCVVLQACRIRLLWACHGIRLQADRSEQSVRHCPLPKGSTTFDVAKILVLCGKFLKRGTHNRSASSMASHLAFCMTPLLMNLTCVEFIGSRNRVFLLGPSHHAYLRGCALSTASHYMTPLGAPSPKPCSPPSSLSSPLPVKIVALQ